MVYRLQQLHEEGVPSLLAGIATEQQWQRKRESIRRVWLDYVGEQPERLPIRYEVLSETELADHVRMHIRYETANADTVTAFLLMPRDRGAAPLPAVLALHPTDEKGKEDVATAQGRDNRRYALELAQRGYIVLAPDTIAAGERISSPEAYFTADFYARNPGWTAVGKMVIDHQYGIDLLCDLAEVDSERIGAIGHSLGGYNSFFLAAADSRIRAYVSSCGFSTFAGDPEPERWGQRDWFSHIPRLSADLGKGEVPFEFHEIAALAAPTPAFYYSGQQDTIFPHWQSYSQGMAQLFELYTFLGKGDCFQYTMTNGEHDFPGEIRQMAYAFLDRHLQKEQA